MDIQEKDARKKRLLGKKRDRDRERVRSTSRESREELEFRKYKKFDISEEDYD